MDTFLIILLLVFIGVFMLVGFKLIWTYEQPEDGWSMGTAPPKIIFIITITLACLCSIVLPLDVQNVNLTGAGLTEIWTSLFTIIVVMGCVGVPAAMFYYEAVDDIGVPKGQRLPFLLFRLFAIIAFCVVITAVMYSFLNTATLPVMRFSCPTLWDKAQVTAPTIDQLCRRPVRVFLQMQVNIKTYLIAITAFAGWWFFIFFGAAGMTSLPLGLILAFADRPSAIDLQTYTNQRQALGDQAKALAVTGKGLQEKEKDLRDKTGFSANRHRLALQREFNKFRQSVYLVEMNYKRVEIALKDRGEHPVIAALKLVAGIISLLLTFTWIIHIGVYVLAKNFTLDRQPISLFLNTVLLSFQEGPFYVVGFVFFLLMSLYLLACVISGATRYGMKLFCIPIHPMREGDTPLNSLLFNSLIILFSTAAIIQFTFICFQDYA